MQLTRLSWYSRRARDDSPRTTHQSFSIIRITLTIAATILLLFALYLRVELAPRSADTRSCTNCTSNDTVSRILHEKGLRLPGDILLPSASIVLFFIVIGLAMVEYYLENDINLMRNLRCLYCEDRRDDESIRGEPRRMTAVQLMVSQGEEDEPPEYSVVVNISSDTSDSELPPYPSCRHTQ